jgi:hypothetical protein
MCSSSLETVRDSLFALFGHWARSVAASLANVLRIVIVGARAVKLSEIADSEFSQLLFNYRRMS